MMKILALTIFLAITKLPTPFQMNSQQVQIIGSNLCSKSLQFTLTCPMQRCYVYLQVLKAHCPMPCLFAFQLAWTLALELRSETAQSILFSAVAFLVAGDGAQIYDSVF